MTGPRTTAIALCGLILAAQAAGPASAQRPDLRTMTCAEANRLVAREGAVVMTTGRHTFQRFVASPAFCDRWEGTRPEYHPARDREACPLPVCFEPMLPLDIFD